MSYYRHSIEAVIGDTGKLICDRGHIHTYDQDATCLADRVALIIRVNPDTGHATYTHGIALALADEGSMDWSTAITTCDAKNTAAPVTDALWMLPSKVQWERMNTASGGNSSLRSGFSSKGGTDMDEKADYWTGTEYSSPAAWRNYYNRRQSP